MKSIIQPYVNLKVYVYDIRTKNWKLYTYHNLIVMAGRNLLRNFLNDDSPNGLSYFSIGDDDTAVNANNTALGNEVFRKAFTQTNKTDANLNIKTYLGSTEANSETIKEAALFGGAATGAADSGTLYARVVLNTPIEKTASIGVTFDWDCGFTV